MYHIEETVYRIDINSFDLKLMIAFGALYKVLRKIILKNKMG